VSRLVVTNDCHTFHQHEAVLTVGHFAVKRPPATEIVAPKVT